MSWDRGYCPICRHWPVMAHIHQGRNERTLWCLKCGIIWPLSRLQYIYCCNANMGNLILSFPAMSVLFGRLPVTVARNI